MPFKTPEKTTPKYNPNPRIGTSQANDGTPNTSGLRPGPPACPPGAGPVGTADRLARS